MSGGPHILLYGTGGDVNYVSDLDYTEPSEEVEPSRHGESSEIVTLARLQLSAYNRADLKAFCACYHPDVVVLDAEGSVSLRGMDAFRARYAPMFERGGFGAEVPQRVHAGEHCIDYELYWRDATTETPRVTGEVLVRYLLRDNLIGVVQFFKPERSSSQ